LRRSWNVLIEASCLFGDVDLASLDDAKWITNRLGAQNSKLLEREREKGTGSKVDHQESIFHSSGMPFFKVVISFPADVSLLGDMISVSLVACRAFHFIQKM
jgi:hypothetical protein